MDYVTMRISDEYPDAAEIVPIEDAGMSRLFEVTDCATGELIFSKVPTMEK